MRVAVGSILIYSAVAGLETQQKPKVEVLLILTVVGGVLLLAGLWTPVAGTVLGILESVTIEFGREDVRTSLVLGAASIALAMTVPGVWSVDAHLFGRRRLKFAKSQSEDSSSSPPP